MKKILSVMLVSVMMLAVLAGCGSKMQAQTVDGVKEVLAATGKYKEEDARYKETLSSKNFSVLLTNKWTVSFMDFGSNASACTDEYNFSKMTVDVISETTESNYTILESELGDTFKLMVRVDNTLLFVMGPKSDESGLKSLAADLGYYVY